MAIPSYVQFIEPLLRFLEKHPGGASIKAAHDAADALGLSSEDRQLLLPSGKQAVYKNRAGWAHDRLKRAGLSTRLQANIWQLTPAGFEFAKKYPSPIPNDVLEKLINDHLDVRLRPATVSTPGSDKAAEFPIEESPDERLESALSELRDTVSSELLDALAHVSPTYFESIVLDLLHAMGYGATRDDLQRVGGVGDGGIDGVISLDRLGLEKVYVQAKRWQNSVGRPEIQAFYGALAGQHASKGIFITTSVFTQQAIDFAKSVEGIVLVDGKKLAYLMIDHEIGVTRRPVHVPKLDSDYFDE